ncbi:MAG TPA: hypothetical protein VFI29_20620 [Hanamia sp.]|nr:hypothetical protein [Hanamia sp.]
MNNSAVEKQIGNYLSLLDPSQKKTVLNVVKTIAMATREYDNLWEDDSFGKEMESRTSSFENGTAKLYKFEDMKKTAISEYKKKKGLKK